MKKQTSIYIALVAGAVITLATGGYLVGNSQGFKQLAGGSGIKPPVFQQESESAGTLVAGGSGIKPPV